jgi:hypothetical protein
MIPGGIAGVAEEVALSAQQIRMAANPYASARQLIAAPQLAGGIDPNRR